MLSGSNSYSAGTSINGGTLQFGSLTSLGTGDISLDGGGLRWGAGNAADISSRAVTIAVGGAVLDTNGNNVTLTNPIGNGGLGGLTKAGAGTLTLEAANTYKGTTTVTGGTLAVAFNGALGDEASGGGLILNGGKLAVSASFSLDFAGTGVRPVTVGAAGGGVDVADGAVLTIPGAVSGSGTLTKSGAGGLLLAGANAATFTGAVQLTGGTVELGGGQPNGQQALGTGSVTFNGGTLNLNGYLADNGNGWGTLGNALIVPEGQTGTVAMTTRGTMSSTLSGAGTFNLRVNYVRGDVVANWTGFTGQINVLQTDGGNADDFRLAGFVALNIPSARLNLGDGVNMYQSFNPPTGTGGTIHNIGELSGSAGAVLGGNPVADRFLTWTVGALNTDSTFAGVIQNNTGAARLTKTGTGTLTLSGISTYTGETTVQDGTLLVSGGIAGTTAVNLSGGRLLLGANDAINDLAAINLTAGKLSTGGFSDSVGALTLTGSATLDLGAGTSVLHFADSSLSFWFGLLDIENWSGSLSGSGTDQVFFGTTDTSLTADQLAVIQFTNPAGLAPGVYGARLLTSGELVAIPEPASGAMLLLGCGMLASRRRRAK